ncbi:MAG: 1-acyl-sn-glycerol-3-phosphate acyltransferase [Proteobacteria bacterium]|nr:1-acyl-sn-glycerol-3-phosphate acyltransferase [Pseudomonadota bacterium]MBI3499398.1 1-acyl-sn-glycerol-3-phosphate acyltransferase [Pseudomonadota bacterium]
MWLRSLAFNIAFYLWTTLVVVVASPSLACRRTVLIAVARFWARGAVWLLKAICRLDYRIEGGENLPTGAVIIAAKHQSAWDTFIFNVFLEDPAYVLKRELLLIPFYGWYAARAGMISVDRSGHASALKYMVRQAERAAAAGRQIVIFPQGTRIAPGESKAYLPGVQALYGKLGVPVVPVALDSGLYWGRRGFLKRPGTIRLVFLPAIPPGLKRAAFTERLETAIETVSNRLIAASSEPALGGVAADQG